MAELFDNSWDTEFFGFKTGSLKLNEFSTKTEIASLLDVGIRKYHLLYVFSDIDDIRLLGDYSKYCTYVDNRVTFSKNPKKSLDSNPEIYEFSDKSRLKELYPLAYVSGNFSRFNMDKGFPEEKFESLYRKMIDNSIFLSFADSTFIFGKDKYRGFITVKKVNNTARIGLIGVDHESQGL